MAGKKKRGHPDLEEVVARPWCYYCERDFDDLKILISHQKAKHFKCERCGRRLNTAGGLSVHMNQVHKETLTSVDNALGNRASLDVEIFGMEGIPEDVVQAHNQRIIAQFYQAEADRRAATGNRGPGNGAGAPSKKPKFESPAELKKRLAEHKARMAEQAGGVSSGANTPGAGIPSSQSPVPALSPPFTNAPYAPPPAPYSAPPGASYGSFSQEPYAQPVPAYQQPYTQQPGFAPPVSQYPPQQPPYSGAPTYPPQPAFSPTGYQQPPASFPPAAPSYGAGAPPGYNPYQPPSYAPPISSLPARPPSLPQAPGLPQRPSFGAPPTAQYPAPPQGAPQQGGWGPGGWNAPDYQNQAVPSGYPPAFDTYAANAPTGTPAPAREPDDIDELIRMAEAGIKPPKKAETPPEPAAAPALPKAPAPAPEQAPTPEVPSAPAAPEVSEKKPKKDKEKATKMVYADNEVSPEEKMAKLSRYAFIPEKKEEAVLVDANQAPGVAGTIRE